MLIRGNWLGDVPFFRGILRVPRKVDRFVLFQPDFGFKETVVPASLAREFLPEMLRHEPSSVLLPFGRVASRKVMQCELHLVDWFDRSITHYVHGICPHFANEIQLNRKQLALVKDTLLDVEDGHIGLKWPILGRDVLARHWFMANMYKLHLALSTDKERVALPPGHTRVGGRSL